MRPNLFAFDEGDIEAVVRLIEEGVPDPPSVPVELEQPLPLAADRLGDFGAVLYAIETANGYLSKVQVVVQYGGEWMFEGSGTEQGPNLLGDRALIAPPNGPYVVPLGSGCHRRDDGDKHWNISYIKLRATPGVVRLVHSDGLTVRESFPASHGNLVILFAGPELPAVAGYDQEKRLLFERIETQRGFGRWLSERKRRPFAW